MHGLIDQIKEKETNHMKGKNTYIYKLVESTFSPANPTGVLLRKPWKPNKARNVAA